MSTLMLINFHQHAIKCSIQTQFVVVKGRRKTINVILIHHYKRVTSNYLIIFIRSIHYTFKFFKTRVRI